MEKLNFKHELMHLAGAIEEFRHDILFSGKLDDLDDYEETREYFLLCINALEQAQRFASIADLVFTREKRQG